MTEYTPYSSRLDTSLREAWQEPRLPRRTRAGVACPVDFRYKIIINL